MKKRLIWGMGILMLLSSVSCVKKQDRNVAEDDYTGSVSCIQCHEKFYELWSPSHHGQAMQPVNAAFREKRGVPPSEEFTLEGKIYSIAYEDTSMVMLEKSDSEVNRFPILWALGGKNVFYFLTPLDKGKLQTVPLAYDLRKQAWYNNPESAVRHFPEGIPDEALPWKDRMYTFNTACYSCHVSQLKTNFDLMTDSYNTTWKEPGINCETCHGPSGEHVRAALEAERKGKELKDLKLIVTSTFTPQQHNSSCAPCHAKMQPITAGFMPGELYFDNFDLTTLENADFYPDGRDLGENYTYTGWQMNPCTASSDLHCVTCHTSSGRDRFATRPNDACISCHSDKGENLTMHTGHEADSPGSLCINCHMPKTEFGRMVRSDHSFRPPMPEATMKFGSPNACNLCHTDQSAEWANEVVKKRKNSNYQQETLEWAQLIKEARANEWQNAGKMLAIITDNDKDEVVKTSFLRLLINYPGEEKWEVIAGALKHESPLVRSAAASGLLGNHSEMAREALLAACTDNFRLVRISAATALASFPSDRFNEEETKIVAHVTDEYMQSLVVRPDDWSSHYNLGLFHQNRGEAQAALESYEVAARLYPESLMPLINSSVLYSYIGDAASAEKNLRQAIEIDPDNEAANLNLGLLLAEQNRLDEAEDALKRALLANPQQGVAAYNLSVIVARRDLEKAVGYAKIAAEAMPGDPKYAYTLAYFMLENNQKAKAANVLEDLLKENPTFLNAVSLLADIYIREHQEEKAIKLYQETMMAEGLTSQDRDALQRAINTVRQGM